MCRSMTIHSARGALFENLVISELLKRRFNQGLPSNLYFWRNNTGDEVDTGGNQVRSDLHYGFLGGSQKLDML